MYFLVCCAVSFVCALCVYREERWGLFSRSNPAVYLAFNCGGSLLYKRNNTSNHLTYVLCSGGFFRFSSARRLLSTSVCLSFNGLLLKSPQVRWLHVVSLYGFQSQQILKYCDLIFRCSAMFAVVAIEENYYFFLRLSRKCVYKTLTHTSNGYAFPGVLKQSLLRAP